MDPAESDAVKTGYAATALPALGEDFTNARGGHGGPPLWVLRQHRAEMTRSCP